jgi:hypothetical protein
MFNLVNDLIWFLKFYLKQCCFTFKKNQNNIILN